MSSTLATVEYGVRALTRDRDRANYAIESRRLRRIIRHHAMTFAARMGFPYQSIAAFVTLSDSGSNDFTPSYVLGEPDRIAALKLVSTGDPIWLVGPDYLELIRHGNPAQAGDPYFAAVLEGAAQAYQLRFYPRPNKADTVSAVLSEFMASTLTDSTVVPLSEIALRAVEALSAISCVALMSPARRQELGLDEGATQELRAMAATAAPEAISHHGRLSRTPVGVDFGAWRNR